MLISQQTFCIASINATGGKDCEILYNLCVSKAQIFDVTCGWSGRNEREQSEEICLIQILDLK